MHDDKEFAEKGIQLVKNEFISKKRNFAGNLMEKICCNKILNYLANDKLCDSSSKCNFPNCYMKITKFLNEILKRGLPVLFVLDENEEYLFLMNIGHAKCFVLCKCVKTLIGLNYSELE